MGEEDGPRRLKRRRDTSRLLAHALLVLQYGAEDAARLKRVAAELSALLDTSLASAQPSPARELRRLRICGPPSQAASALGQKAACGSGALQMPALQLKD